MARQTFRPGRDQVPTVETTIHAIMATPEFAVGVADVRRGRPHRDAYQAWHTNAQWNYERGRQWARLVPPSIILKRDGRVTAEALSWGRRVFKDIL
jgi:hypothetical protein